MEFAGWSLKSPPKGTARGEGGGGGVRGRACNGSTIPLRSFAQSFCMPARFHARGTVPASSCKAGMRLDDDGG